MLQSTRPCTLGTPIPTQNDDNFIEKYTRLALTYRFEAPAPASSLYIVKCHHWAVQALVRVSTHTSWTLLPDADAVCVANEISNRSRIDFSRRSHAFLVAAWNPVCLQIILCKHKANNKQSGMTKFIRVNAVLCLSMPKVAEKNIGWGVKQFFSIRCHFKCAPPLRSISNPHAHTHNSRGEYFPLENRE